MRTIHRLCIGALGTALASLVAGAGAANPTGSEAVARDARNPSHERVAPPAPHPAGAVAKPSEGSASGAVLYVPPEIGFPARRIGGGTRGLGRVASLQILAPDHLGYTTLEQPTLYWYLAEPTPVRMDFTLRDEGSVEPLVEVRLPAPAQAGIHALRLADFGARLAPGVRYLWFVSLVPDPERRSKDFTVGAWISRLQPDDALRARLEAADGREALAYAEAGLWYDAIGSLSAHIASAPADAAARDQRAALLEQVGLSDAAAYDRERGAEH